MRFNYDDRLVNANSLQRRKILSFKYFHHKHGSNVTETQAVTEFESIRKMGITIKNEERTRKIIKKTVNYDWHCI